MEFSNKQFKSTMHLCATGKGKDTDFSLISVCKYNEPIYVNMNKDELEKFKVAFEMAYNEFQRRYALPDEETEE